MDNNNALWTVWSVFRLSLSCLLCPCIQPAAELSLSISKRYHCQGFWTFRKGRKWRPGYEVEKDVTTGCWIDPNISHNSLGWLCDTVSWQGSVVPLRHAPWEAVRDWTTLSFGWQLTHVPQVPCSHCNDNFTPWASSPTWLTESQWASHANKYWHDSTHITLVLRISLC